MRADIRIDVQTVINKCMPFYRESYRQSQFMNLSMCRAMVYARKCRAISSDEWVAGQLAVDEFMDHASRNQDDPDTFLIYVLAESGCENPTETALRIYQNWDERMTILHEATDVKESV